MTAKGYWIVEVEIFDADKYKAYTDVVRPFLAKVGGRFIVRGAPDRLEGAGKPRMVVIEFDSYAKALEGYRSAEYQAMIALREVGARADFAVIDGMDG